MSRHKAIIARLIIEEHTELFGVTLCSFDDCLLVVQVPALSLECRISANVAKICSERSIFGRDACQDPRVSPWLMFWAAHAEA